MGQDRSQLHDILKDILGTDRVYFQAPPNTGMEYPCIVYRRSNADTQFADDIPYRITRKYEVTVIDASPDSTILDKVAALPTSLHNRYYAANNLNHDVYTLYF